MAVNADDSVTDLPAFKHFLLLYKDLSDDGDVYKRQESLCPLSVMTFPSRVVMVTRKFLSVIPAIIESSLASVICEEEYSL